MSQLTETQPRQNATVASPRSGGGDAVSLDGSDGPGGIVTGLLRPALTISVLALLGALVMRKRS
ncbi:MAG: hypothetical protein ACRDTF_23620 [Pseudonocardiaceae bacterium]